MRCRLLAIALLLAASGCGDDGAAPLPTAEEAINKATAAMTALESARFVMSSEGAPVTVSGLEFVSAVGQYAAPTSAWALLRLKAGDLTIEIGTISVADRTWLENPLTGEMEELTPGTGFNPALIFDADVGWRPLLESDLSEVAVEGSEGSGDALLWVLTGTVSRDRIAVLTAGFAGNEDVPMRFWIRAATGHIVRLEFSTTGDAGVSDWVIELSEFNEPVTIEPPSD
jgi:hypothetical protein